MGQFQLRLAKNIHVFKQRGFIYRVTLAAELQF